MTSTQRNAYTASVKRISTEVIPTSDITAQAVVADGFTLSQTDHAGITTTASRSYTATGMTMTQTDGRGNATTTVMDKAGRPVSVTDAAGNTTSTSYDANHDQPSVVTDAQGHTACYRYDTLGRPTARNTARQGTTKNDTFAYNNRSELTGATVSGATYSYAYDNIGNRKSAQEAAEEVTNYTANALNQYTAIDDFVPTYNTDGKSPDGCKGDWTNREACLPRRGEPPMGRRRINQTLVKTTTGIWSVQYNAENRPITSRTMKVTQW